MTETPKKLRGFPGEPRCANAGRVHWVVQEAESRIGAVASGPSSRTKPAAIRAWNRMVEKAMGERP